MSFSDKPGSLAGSNPRGTGLCWPAKAGAMPAVWADAGVAIAAAARPSPIMPMASRRSISVMAYASLSETAESQAGHGKNGEHAEDAPLEREQDDRGHHGEQACPPVEAGPVGQVQLHQRSEEHT